jgi:hypothetical protein
MEAAEFLPIAPGQSEIDYVRKAHFVQPPHVTPITNGATKCQPLGHPKHPHAVASFVVRT